MTGHLGARLGAALVVGAIWLGAIAAPAAAAGTVRYVDDNPNSTSCHGTHRHSIQGAINASGPGDTVLVCPGTYEEELVIDVKNLTVMATKYRKATLVPPAPTVTGDLGSGAMVVIEANGVTFRGFNISIPGGPPMVENLQGGVTECFGYEAAVVVLGNRAKVWGNKIVATGENTLSGECGYLFGILVLGELLPAFPALGPNATSLKRNYIRDFKFGGIFVEGPGANVRAFWNSIRFVHQDDPVTCVPVNTITIGPAVQEVCDPPFSTDFSQSTHLQGLNGLFLPFVGIAVGFGAKADIGHNTVYSTLEPDSVPLGTVQNGFPIGGPPFLLFGILFEDAAPGSRIIENVVQQTLVGISIDPDDIPLATVEPDTSAPNGTEVTYNRSLENFFGFLIDGEENLLYANRARLNFIGVLTEEGHHNTFIQNDFRYNYPFGPYDCLDETSGDGDEDTDNYWEDNLGNSNDPEDICISTTDF